MNNAFRRAIGPALAQMTESFSRMAVALQPVLSHLQDLQAVQDDDMGAFDLCPDNCWSCNADHGLEALDGLCDQCHTRLTQKVM